jgi:predicted permease
MSGWIRDVACALRRFLRAPWFFAGLIFVLALGTGANTAIFSLVYTVLLQPLPYERSEELVMVWNARNTPANWRAHSTKERVLAWRDSSDAVFSDLAVLKLWDGSREAWIDLVLGDRAERLRAGIVTSNFFRVLGVSAAIGRVFSPDDEAAGNTDVIVLGDGLWRRAFGADPAVVGRQIVLTTGDFRNRRARPYVVLGILPRDFQFTYPLDTELWTVAPWAAVEASPRGAIMFNGAVARLKPGVPLAAAAARMADVPAGLNGSSVPVERREVTRLEPISEWVVAEIRPSLLLLAGTSLILLVITCATVAGALLVRLAERQRELAVRASLGANRFRLAREAVSDALALSACGTGAGLLLAVAILPVFRALVPSIVPRADEIGLTLWLLLFAAAVTAGYPSSAGCSGETFDRAGGTPGCHPSVRRCSGGAACGVVRDESPGAVSLRDRAA